MNDKQAYEAFRVKKFAQPHPALQLHKNVLTDWARGDSTARHEPDQAPPPFEPHVKSPAAADDARGAARTSLLPDHERIIVHFDVDCFYAQVEECRNPALRGQPLAVTQKYLVVTSNYPARAAGVTKLMPINDAKKICPSLILVPGEDLSPYRAASRSVRAVLSRWGTTEKLGLDESWVDITQEVDRRFATGSPANTLSSLRTAPWSGHLLQAGLQLTADTKHRPMDLRALQHQQQHYNQQQQPSYQETLHTQEQHRQQQHPFQHNVGQHKQVLPSQQQEQHGQCGSSGGNAGSEQCVAPAVAGQCSDLSQQTHECTSAVGNVASGFPEQPLQSAPDCATPASCTGSSSCGWIALCELRLKLGAVIAAEMRQAVQQETGFRCSAGIACSKLLSKLVSGLHKPDDQTTILPLQGRAFVAPLPVRALPGVGYKSEAVLKSWGLNTAADLCCISRAQLIKAFGEKQGASLFCACRGVDASPVNSSGPPKSITVEDSFKACSSWQAVANVLQVLVPDLLDKLQEDAEEFPQLGRVPSTLTLKWRKAGTGWARSSASAPWPSTARIPALQSPSRQPKQHQQQGIVQALQHAPAEGVGMAHTQSAALAGLSAAATSLLKQHLSPSGFSLTMLNIGATGFKHRATREAGALKHFLMPRQASAAATQQSSILDQARSADPIQQQFAQGMPLPKDHRVGPSSYPHYPAGSKDLLQHAKAITMARRDYNRALSNCVAYPAPSTSLPHHSRQRLGTNGPTTQTSQEPVAGTMVQSCRPLLSKRQERQLWDMAMQQQQHKQPSDCCNVQQVRLQMSLQQPSMPPAQQQVQQSLSGQKQHQSHFQQLPAGLQHIHQSQHQQQQPPAQHQWQHQGSVLPSATSFAQHCLQQELVERCQEPLAKRRCVLDAPQGPSPCCRAATDGSLDPASVTASAAQQHSMALEDTCLGAVVGVMAETSQGVAADVAAVGSGVCHCQDTAGGTLNTEAGVSSCCMTSLHSMEGWGVVACEVIEGFDDGCEDDCCGNPVY